MPTLHVAFQEGFSNDEVVVYVNGAEVFRKSGITTKLQIGYADAIDVEVASGMSRLDVNVVTRNTTATTLVTVSDRTYVGVSLDRSGQPTYQVSAEPFRYL
jgi:hypothetical protein